MTRDRRALDDDIHLVACTAQKRDGPDRAADLYCSEWFAKARDYVEATGTRWYILSAAHGLVRPSERLSPYDASLTATSASERLAWAKNVIRQLRCKIDPRHSGRIVFLAGTHYREHLMALAGERAITPMAGLGIGQQKAWLARETALLCPRRRIESDAVMPSSDDGGCTHGMRVSPWSDLAEWHGELDRQTGIMAPRRKLYRRFEAKARQLSTQRIRTCQDKPAIERLVAPCQPRDTVAAHCMGSSMYGRATSWGH